MDSVRIIKNNQDKNKADIYDQQSKHINREKEIGYVNYHTGAFLISKEDGELASGIDDLNQTKQTPQYNLDVSPEKKEVCNRKHLISDDILINHQKMNTQLLRISDTTNLYEDSSIGGFMADGTVLVRVWEKHLKRYVLMRRPIRTPLFSRTLSSPEISDILEFDIAHIQKLDTNLAQFIRKRRLEESKVTDEMIDAEGGSNYNQGNYNNYNDNGFDNSGANDNSTLPGGPGSNYYIPSDFIHSIVVTQDLVPLGDLKRSGKKIPELNFITIHSTGSMKATARNIRDNLKNVEKGRETVAWHYVIDEKECIMAIPPDEIAHHARAGNSKSFGIEICQNGNRQLTVDRAATFTAELLAERGWNISNMKRHSEWSATDCPEIFNLDGKWTGWADFKTLVKTKLDQLVLVNSNPNQNAYCWPCRGAATVTAKLGDGRNHDGWDISTTGAFYKNIPICATKDGIVELVNQQDGAQKRMNGYGACVLIDHGEGIKTLYAHMKNNSVVVKEGAQVRQGEHIGVMGNTGSVKKSANGDGTHLHFSIYRYDSDGTKTVIDPEGLLDSNS